MAQYIIASSNGNWTANSWSTVSNTGTGTANASLMDTSGPTQTDLTASFANCSPFVLENKTFDGFAVKFMARAFGPNVSANTVTVEMFNVTNATIVCTQTLLISDIDQCTGGSAGYPNAGGWYFIKAAATWTPNGTDTFIIRAKQTGLLPLMSLAANTGSNWNRLVRVAPASANTAPSANDIIHIMGEWTGPATMTPRSITMDSTANTQYGVSNVTSNTMNYRTPAVMISKGGTLQWNTAANTTLQILGFLHVVSNGKFIIGNTANPIPAGTTASLLIDGNGNDGVITSMGATISMVGSPRTTGKAIAWTLATSNANSTVNNTNISTQDDTGWLPGDEVYFASCNRASGETELKVLNTVNSSAVNITTTFASFHGGSAANFIQAELLNLTRNIRVSNVAATGYEFACRELGNCDIEWTSFTGLSSSNNSSLFFSLANTDSFASNGNVVATGSLTVKYIVVRTSAGAACGLKYWGPPNNSGQVVIFDNNIVANVNGIGMELSAWSVNANLNGNVSVTNTAICRILGVGFNHNCPVDPRVTVSNIHVFSCLGSGVPGWQWSGSNQFADGHGQILGDIIIHSWNGPGMTIAPSFHMCNLGFNKLLIWRTAGPGLNMSTAQGMENIAWKQLILFSNSSGANWSIGGGPMVRLFVQDLRLYDDSQDGTAGTSGIQTQNAYRLDLLVANGDFGSNTISPFTSMACDLDLRAQNLGAAGETTLVFNNTLFTSPVLVNAVFNNSSAIWPGGGNYGSVIRLGNYNRTNNHKIITPLGNVVYETTTVDVSPSIKMTPSGAGALVGWKANGLRLRTHGNERGKGFLTFVKAGDSPTLSIKIQVDATYNGDAPRLVVYQNAALGMANDAMASWSGSTGVWNTVSVSLGAVTADGVLEAYVDCDGSAGNVYLDTFAAS